MDSPNEPRANDLVVVTGASRGIGRATARSLVLDHNTHVLALSRDSAALALLAEDCAPTRGQLQVTTIDLADGDMVQQVLAAIAGRKVRALIHNAGHLHNRPMGQHTQADLQRAFHINAVAPLLLSQALVSHLAGDPPGHILHISSMGGFQDSVKFPGLVGYSASKAALACMAQCLAVEFSDRGIHSNCLALGSVDTEMLRAAFPNYKAPTTPADMGAFIAEFALRGHRFFNGKVLPVAVSTP